MKFEKYDANGWIDFNSLFQIPATFYFLIGARGIGKTFGGLLWPIENNKEFMFMRKTRAELDMLKKPGFTPFDPINTEKNRDITLEPEGHMLTRVKENNITRGHMVALSDVAKLRGFNADSLKYILYDEFIHEAHEKPMKNEAEAFFNAYETMNRNRELDGRPPIRAVLAANSNEIKNDFFMYLRIAERFERLRKKGKSYFIDKERGLCVIDYSDSPISLKKKNTALYKLTAGTDFSKMAIDNEFVTARTDKIKSENIAGYILETKIGELYIYKHKSNGRYYVTMFRSGTPAEEVNPAGEGRKYIIRRYIRYYNAFVNDRLLFENTTCLYLFEKYYSGR